MWLDLASPVTVARVVAKKESVSFESNPDGGWTSAWRLAVRFPTADEREHDALITVEQEVFDSVRVGSRPRVRYLACCPIFARSADRSTLSLLGDVRREHDLPRATTLLWLAIGLVATVVAAWLPAGDTMRAARIGLATSTVVAALWVGMSYALRATGRVGPWLIGDGVSRPATVTGTAIAHARVMRVALVTEWEQGEDVRRLPAPYEIAEFAFLPAGAVDSVRGADAVDARSVAGLVEHATVPVRYDPRSPRSARLVAGTRSFHARNRTLYWLDLVMIGLTFVFVAFGVRFASKHRTGVRAEE